MRRSALACAAACAALALPASAGAHTGVRSYSPRPGSTVARDLSVVRVTFKSRVAAGRLTVKRGGVTVSVGDGRLVNDHRTLRVRLKSGLRAGGYTASMRVLHTDGHVQSKSWSFRLR
jgi:methionine-rich copper-binding protein CopC